MSSFPFGGSAADFSRGSKTYAGFGPDQGLRRRCAVFRRVLAGLLATRFWRSTSNSGSAPSLVARCCPRPRRFLQPSPLTLATEAPDCGGVSSPMHERAGWRFL